MEMLREKKRNLRAISFSNFWRTFVIFWRAIFRME